MKTRQLAAAEYAFLKAATRRLVTTAGGVESAAQVSRVNKSAIGDYQNPLTTASFMPVDVLADLERDTGVNYVTEALVKLAGGYMVKLPPLEHRTEFANHLAAIGREVAQVFERSGVALADGKISKDERARVITEITEAIQTLAQARGSLERQAEGG